MALVTVAVKVVVPSILIFCEPVIATEMTLASEELELVFSLLLIDEFSFEELVEDLEDSDEFWVDVEPFEVTELDSPCEQPETAKPHTASKGSNVFVIRFFIFFSFQQALANIIMFLTGRAFNELCVILIF